MKNINVQNLAGSILVWFSQILRFVDFTTTVWKFYHGDTENMENKFQNSNLKSQNSIINHKSEIFNHKFQHPFKETPYFSVFSVSPCLK
jgi:hypothetical protein